MVPSKIFDVLSLSRKIRQNNDIFNVLLVGAPGLGKTEIVQQWCENQNLKYITMTLSSYDPPDFKGFPNIVTVDGKQRMSFATPEFWPDTGEGVIILEELNRANTSIMQCILSLTDKRRGFDGYTLPPGWMVVGCINPEDGNYDTIAMDPALKDRFEMFPITYDKRSFMDYMQAAKWDESLFNFVESGIWHYKLPEEVGQTPGNKYTSPRTLSKLNALLKAGVPNENELEMYGVILGNNLGKDFYQFKHDEAPVMMNDLEKSLKKSLSKLKKFSNPNNYKNGMISLTVKDIVTVNTIKDDVLAEVIKVIPVEQSTNLIMELEMVRKDETILTRLAANYPEIKSLLKSVIRYGETK